MLGTTWKVNCGRRAAGTVRVASVLARMRRVQARRPRTCQGVAVRCLLQQLAHEAIDHAPVGEAQQARQ